MPEPPYTFNRLLCAPAPLNYRFARQLGTPADVLVRTIPVEQHWRQDSDPKVHALIHRADGPAKVCQGPNNVTVWAIDGKKQREVFVGIDRVPHLEEMRW